MKRISVTTGSYGRLSNRSFLRKINQGKKQPWQKNEEIISDDVDVANTPNTFFLEIVKNLKFPEKFEQPPL